MKELCRETGLARQAIHFYIQTGLLPSGHKTGPNVAFYGPEHLERLRLIKRLQHERFLPLKAIKAMLDGREEQFSDEQQRFLKAVRSELATSLAPSDDAAQALLDPAPLLEAHGMTEAELQALIELGIVGAAPHEKAPTVAEPRRRAAEQPIGAAERRTEPGLRIAAEDAWVFDYVGRMRAAGFTRERGFEVSLVAAYADAVDAILRRDIELISNRLTDLSPELVARMLERAMPLVHEFISRRHARRVNDYLSSI
jgi:DNA-binding transcriptional MerR regulator